MASLKDIKVNVNVDTTDFIKKLRQLQESIKMDDVRILKGWTKDEREALKKLKKFIYPELGITKLFNYANTELKPLSDKISNDNGMRALTDIVDFVNDKAKFAEQKYVLETTAPISLARTYIKRILRSTYGGVGAADEIETTSDKNEALALSEDSIIKNLGGKYMTFAEPVEEVSDDE